MRLSQRMQHCDLTLPTPEANLACDEALLDCCEEGGANELLRCWEPKSYFIVVGYANQAATEVDLDYCQREGLPVLRRCSGGGTILQGPGCLNYTLVLRITEGSPLATIHDTNAFVLERHRTMVSQLVGGKVERQGDTDLSVGGLKFSGNAQRRRKHCLLFHGTFLLNVDIEMVERALPMPSRQPGYRLNRSHTDFLVNLKLPPATLKSALVEAWQAAERFEQIPGKEIEILAREKYRLDEWNRKF